MSLALEQIGMEPGKSFRFLAWTDNLSDVVQCRADGSRKKLAGVGDRWHFHPEYELTLITEGKGKRFVGDHVENFTAPDLVLIGPNLPHCWSDLRESSGFAIQFVLDSNHPMGQLDEMCALETTLQDSNFGIHFTGSVVQRIETLMWAIADQSKLARLANFIGVLAELSDAPEHERLRLCGNNLKLPHHVQHMAAISRAVSFILNNLEEEIGIDKLLKVTNMSKPTFSRHFKSHTGHSLTTFLNEIRIVNAKRLLAETNESITDIAFRSGFRNLSHFNMQFRRLCGKSPRDFRKYPAVDKQPDPEPVIPFEVEDYTDSGLSTAGTLVGALNVGNAAMVNTVPFSAITTGYTNPIALSGGVELDAFNGVGDGSQALGAPGALTNVFFFTNGADTGYLTFSGLTEGQAYELQLVMSETRDFNLDIWGDQTTNTGASDFFVDHGNNAPKLVTVNFTADAACTKSLYIEVLPDYPGHFNALQLRAIPEPSAALLSNA